MRVKLLDFPCLRDFWLNLSIVWKKSSNSSKFSFFPSNVIVFVNADFDIAYVVGRSSDATPSIASANLLNEVLWSLDARFLGVFQKSTVVSRDICSIMFCSCLG